MNGDCYTYTWEAPKPTPNDDLTKSVKHDFITTWHYLDEIAPSNITQQFCIDQCKEAIDGEKPEYAYAAITSGKYCSCGNMPPKEERFSQCRVSCEGAPDEYCGGYDDQASWFWTGNGPESQGCIYETEPSLDGSFNITKISSQNPYNPGDHCWAEFKCPDGFDVQYNFDYFSIHDYYQYPRDPKCLYDNLYLINDNEAFRWCGEAPNYIYSPPLYEWKSVNATNVDFQFRAYHQYISSYYGFAMRLRCNRK